MSFGFDGLGLVLVFDFGGPLMFHCLRFGLLGVGTVVWCCCFLYSCLVGCLCNFWWFGFGCDLGWVSWFRVGLVWVLLFVGVVAAALLCVSGGLAWLVCFDPFAVCVNCCVLMFRLLVIVSV